MAPRFLCCLPLRLGVFVISLLQFLVCGGFAGFLWWALWYESDHDAVAVAKNIKITTIVVASVSTLVALVSLIGFIGAILRKFQFIKTYSIALAISLGFQIASGIWYLITFYTTRNQSLSDCLDGTTDQTRIDYCNAIQSFKRFPQGYVLANAIIPIVIQFYACYVVRSYSHLLERQNVERNRQVNRVPGPVYQPVNHHDENYPMTHNAPYPYADAPHSFGSKA
jgi:hypothetical protein